MIAARTMMISDRVGNSSSPRVVFLLCMLLKEDCDKRAAVKSIQRDKSLRYGSLQNNDVSSSGWSLQVESVHSAAWLLIQFDRTFLNRNRYTVIVHSVPL